jgi:hypothetical protein
VVGSAHDDDEDDDDITSVSAPCDLSNPENTQKVYRMHGLNVGRCLRELWLLCY